MPCRLNASFIYTQEIAKLLFFRKLFFRLGKVCVLQPAGNDLHLSAGQVDQFLFQGFPQGIPHQQFQLYLIFKDRVQLENIFLRQVVRDFPGA